MKILKRVCYFLMSIILIMEAAGTVQAADQVEQRTVRVGFFSAEGYHVMDESDTMSGYGYDFLQMMLRYNNWNYEYVGYDSNWSDMLDMLESGEIDMVTLANKTPEREELFDYSEKSIGVSSTVMSVSAENETIIPGDYATYNGAVVGLVKGSSHNDKFEEYAKEKGFTYKAVYYEDIDVMLEDLKENKKIDIAVTSNMRLIQDEVILDEFNSTEYYAIVKKGNEDLLDEINMGIDQLDVYSPDWRNTLFEKYYSDRNSKVISLSVKERQYVKALKDNGTVIKAAMNPELCPYSYFEDGQAKGIAPTLFAEIADRLGIEYEILPSADRWEYKEQLNSGEADIDLTAYLDYSLAQKYNLKETDAYIVSSMAMLSRKDSNTNADTMTVAVVRDPTEYIGYNNELIYQYAYKEYESIQDCIDAVKDGEVDATFRYVYIAEQAVTKDYTNQLQYTIMPDYTFSLAIGVSNNRDHRLLSILNKGISSLSSSYVQSVMLEQSTDVEQNVSMLEAVYDHPFLLSAMVLGIVGLFFAIILLLFLNRAQKNKIIAAYEMQRFIGYICESYETVLEINLESHKGIIYSMGENDLQEETEEYNPFSRDYFESRVPADSLQMMVDAFAEHTIDEMISEGGSQNYLECQVKMEDGKYAWHSYLIKAVPKDPQHPRNYVIFKKNIQKIKEGEEEQKQILRDALEAAKSASEAKGQFLSRMSHEIRTPLNAVIGYMGIAKDAKQNPDKMMHCVQNSEIAAKHLLSIINDVLDISSIESGRLKIAREEFDIKAVITAVTTLFYNQAKSKKVKFEVALDQIVHEKMGGDSLRLNQILMNLLSNAVKFTPENGRVTLSVEQVNVSDDKIYMKFTVEDTGIGMSQEYQKRLFQPFEQESAKTAQKYGGTGLGLSITYNLIQMMGGSIEVISQQDKGTKFVVSLHFDKCQEEEWYVNSMHDYSKLRVLVLEDDAAAGRYMKSLLKYCKVHSDVVESEEQAVKQMKRRMSTEYSYDLCLIDWNMETFDAMETVGRMRAECGEKKVALVASAYDVTEVEDEIEQLGVEQAVKKPMFLSDMIDLLNTMTGVETISEQKEQMVESLTGLRILLAEDNEMNLEIAMEILKRAGIQVDPAGDGKQAFDQFLESSDGTYDVILMDVQMPVMDGYEATREIRKSNHPQAATVPIIAMTANAFAEDVNAALVCGMNGHIAKPIDYDKLFTVLKEWTKQKK